MQLLPVLEARSDEEYFYSPLDGMAGHRRVTPPPPQHYPFTHLDGVRHRESKVTTQGPRFIFNLENIY